MLRNWPSLASWGLPAALQKRLVKFLLKRAVGQFLREELDLDHLDVQLGQGLVQLKELALNTELLNELAAASPIYVVDGRIGGISVEIPWKNIWHGECRLEIQDLLLIVAPKEQEHTTTTDESSFMTSSIHFANDFLRHEVAGEQGGDQEDLLGSFTSSLARDQSFLSESDGEEVFSETSGDTGHEGLQVLAGLIDRLMSRVRITIRDTRARILVPDDQDGWDADGMYGEVEQLAERLDQVFGVQMADSLSKAALDMSQTERQMDGVEQRVTALELHIPFVTFVDERAEIRAGDVPTNTTEQKTETGSAPAGREWYAAGVPTHTVKTLRFHGIHIWIRHLNVGALDDVPDTSTLETEETVAEGVDPATDTNVKQMSDAEEHETWDRNSELVCSVLDHENIVNIHIRRQPITGGVANIQYTRPDAPSHWDVDGMIHAVCAVITPEHARILLTLMRHLSNEHSGNRVDKLRRAKSAMSLHHMPSTPGLRHSRTASQELKHTVSSTSSPSQEDTVGLAGDNLDDLVQCQLTDVDTRERVSQWARETGCAPSANTTMQADTSYTMMEMEDADQINYFEEDNESVMVDVFADLDDALSSGPPFLPTQDHASVYTSTLAQSSIYSDSDGGAARSFTSRPSESPTAAQLASRQSRWASSSSSSVSSAASFYTYASTGLPASTQNNRPVSRIRISISEMNLFLIMHQPESSLLEPGDYFESVRGPSTLVAHDHLRLAVNDVTLKYQQFGQTKVGRHRRTKQKGRQTFDARVGRIDLSEWLVWRGALAETQSNIPALEVYSTIMTFDGGLRSILEEYGDLNVDDYDGVLLNGAALAMHVELDSTQDCIIETQPIQINLNVLLLDRLEEYIRVIHEVDQKKKREEQQYELYHGIRDGIADSMAQCVYEDLGDHGISNERKVLCSFRLSTPIVRIRLSIPDMHAPRLETRDGRLEQLYSLHQSIDIDFLQLSLRNLGQDLLHQAIGHQTTKVKQYRLQCLAVHGYLRGMLGNCKAKHFLSISGGDQMLPSIDITLRPKELAEYTVATSTKSAFQQTFALFENDEQVHTTLGPEEDLLYFKQRAIDHSLVVIDIALPTIDISLNKAVYDTLVTIGAHMSVWEPKGFASTATDEEVSMGTESTVFKHENMLEQYGMESIFSEEPSVYYDAHSVNSHRVPAHGGSFLVRINKVNISIHCDTLEQKSSAGSETDEADVALFQLQLTGMRLLMVQKHEGKNEAFMFIECEAFALSRDVGDGALSTFLFRDPSTSGQMEKQAVFISLHLKQESGSVQRVVLSAVLDGIIIRVTPDVQHLRILGQFIEIPPNLPQIDDIQRYIQAHLSIERLCIDYQSDTCKSRASGIFDAIKIGTDIQPHAQYMPIKVVVQEMSVLIVEDGDMLESDSSLGYKLGVYTRAYWKAIGYVPVMSIDYMDIGLRVSTTGCLPLLEVKLSNHLLAFDTCSDSTTTFINMITDLLDHFKDPEAADEDKERAAPQAVVKEDIEDVLATLEDDAFTTTTIKISSHQTEHANAEQDDDLLPTKEDFYSADERYVGDSGSSDYGDDLEFTMSPTKGEWVLDERIAAPETTKEPTQRPQRRRGSMSPDAIVHTSTEESLEVIEDYFALSAEDLKATRSAQSQAKLRVQVRVSDFHVVWRLHDGYDWEISRIRAAAKAEDYRMRRAYMRAMKAQKSAKKDRTTQYTPHETSTADVFANNTDDIEVKQYKGDIVVDDDDVDYRNPFASEEYIEDEDDIDATFTEINMTPSERRQATGQDLDKFKRSNTAKLEVKLINIHLEADLYEPRQHDVYQLCLYVRDVEILDHIHTSVWKKFLTAMRTDGSSAPRESSSNMINIHVKSVRPDPESEEELRVKIRILPLRFYIDQDALNFAIQFFNVEEMINQAKSRPPQPPKSGSPYFERFELRPIRMKIDYKPKKFGLSSLREGQLLELMNLFQLDGSEIMLREVKLTGISGVEKLAQAIQDTWLPHIRYTQVPGFVSGLAPIRSVVNIGSGVADLILLPIEQYRKDGRIIRGLQKGFQSFAKSTAMEALKLGTKLAVGTQVLLEHADDLLSFEPTSSAAPGATAMARQSSFGEAYHAASHSDDTKGRSTRKYPASKYGQQPADFGEGIELAYDSMRRNVGSAAHTIFAIPMEVYEQKGAQGTVKAVVRAVPVAVLRPMIGASEAFSKTLMGLQNTIDPMQRLQMEDKYKKL